MEDGHVQISVYESIQGCINRIEIMKEHDTFCLYEDVNIECQQLVDDEESARRLHAVKTIRKSLDDWI